MILAHLSIIIPNVNWIDTLKNTPLHLFWLGHESVILFFILSGFVLSLPYWEGKQSSYKAYMIRRMCRILLPSGVSVCIAVLMMKFISPGGIAEMSEWFNEIWTKGLSTPELIKHLILLDEIESMTLNPVIWSLVHEFRISLFFPAVVFVLMKTNLKTNIGILMAMPVMYFMVYYVLLKGFAYDMTQFNGYSSYLLTPHYAAFFVLGALLAKHRKLISRTYAELNNRVKAAVMVIGLVLYMYVWLIMPNNSTIHLFIINDWAIAAGSCIFIVASMNSIALKRILLIKPVHFIGKISFSLYLYHMIVIVTMFYLFNGTMPVIILIGLSFIISFGAAAAMYYTVETTSVKLGKYLTHSGSNAKSHIKYLLSRYRQG